MLNREGLSSIEELRSKRLAERQNTLAQSSDHSPPAQSDAPQSSVQERDSKLAAEIRKRAQAEAKRKLERGEVTGGTGRNPIKVCIRSACAPRS